MKSSFLAADLTHCFHSLHVCSCLIDCNIPVVMVVTDKMIPRLHWRIRRGRRPPQRQDCRPTQWSPQQDRCHLSSIQCSAQRSREVGSEAAAKQTVWLHGFDDKRWHYGPRGGKAETRCGKDHRFLLLDGSPSLDRHAEFCIQG